MEQTEINNIEDVILVVGSANIENICQVDGKIKLGTKMESSLISTYGGGGLNIASRLGKYGVKIIPLLTIGNDPEGDRMLDFLFRNMKQGNPEFTKEIDKTMHGMFQMKGKTYVSNIISDRNLSTIFFERRNYSFSFYDHVLLLLTYLETTQFFHKINKIVIGHIHEDEKYSGRLTKWLIDKFKDQSIIYLALGSAQLNLGYDFWKEYIKYTDFVQMNLAEAIRFFGINTKYRDYFSNLINLIIDQKISANITLGPFGSVTIIKGNSNLIVAEIITSPGLNDSTGAGDAFASGFLSKYKGINDTENLKQSVLEGELWASFATNTSGGASKIPSKKELLNYSLVTMANFKDFIEIIDRNEKRITSLLHTRQQAYHNLNN